MTSAMRAMSSGSAIRSAGSGEQVPEPGDAAADDRVGGRGDEQRAPWPCRSPSARRRRCARPAGSAPMRSICDRDRRTTARPRARTACLVGGGAGRGVVGVGGERRRRAGWPARRRASSPGRRAGWCRCGRRRRRGSRARSGAPSSSTKRRSRLSRPPIGRTPPSGSSGPCGRRTGRARAGAGRRARSASGSDRARAQLAVVGADGEGDRQRAAVAGHAEVLHEAEVAAELRVELGARRRRRSGTSATGT